MRTYLTLLTLGIALPAWVATATSSASEGWVRLGNTVRVGGPSVRPERVVEDSRCPMNARCVWAGRVIVQAAVKTGRGTQHLRLTLGEPQRVADGMLTLVSVTPERTAGAKAKSRAYRFAFSFSGGL